MTLHFCMFHQSGCDVSVLIITGGGAGVALLLTLICCLCRTWVHCSSRDSHRNLGWMTSLFLPSSICHMSFWIILNTTFAMLLSECELFDLAKVISRTYMALSKEGHLSRNSYYLPLYDVCLYLSSSCSNLQDFPLHHTVSFTVRTFPHNNSETHTWRLSLLLYCQFHDR